MLRRLKKRVSRILTRRNSSPTMPAADKLRRGFLSRRKLNIGMASAEARPQPAEDRPEPAEDRLKPAEDRPQLAEDRPQLAEDRPQFAEDRPKPAEDRPQLAEDRPRPAPGSLQPAEHGAKPAEDRPQPAEDLSLTSRTRPESRYDGNPSDQLKTVFSEWDLEFGECFRFPVRATICCDGT
jgi:hypothetical protein